MQLLTNDQIKELKEKSHITYVDPDEDEKEMRKMLNKDAVALEIP